ncbi:MAG TPA: lipocalin family protein, partial [Chloroflexota bacterium]
ALAAGVALGLLVGTACSRPVAPLPDSPAADPTPAPPIVLPRDSGPHDALTEWWYFTGHLRSVADGRQFGFEFVVFQARRQGAPSGYLAHFAVSDITGQHFSHQAHFTQTPPAADFPLDVDGWTLDHAGSSDTIQAAMQPAVGAEPAYSVQLRLADDKPPALHHGGYIDYGQAGGSYYYSRTRLSVAGELQQAEGPASSVSGIAWMDHQWGNFVVPSTGGWDWYSLQLDDQTDLMLYLLRSPNGQNTAVYGTRVLADGSTQELGPDEVHAEATGRWTSPHTGAVYPAGWRLSLPGYERLELRPQLADQELWFPGLGSSSNTGTLAYWEGAVTVSGDHSGVGYVELTGYHAD